VFNADYQPVARQRTDRGPEYAPRPAVRVRLDQLRFGPNALYFRGGEMPAYNSFLGYDPTNRVALVVWTNLTVSQDGKPTANSIY
jgi:D-alanyl-D-alanine carboxypeptidase